MKEISNKKLIVILGPTATGKTKLAVRLAKKFKGEIISADSRQVFRGMDLGTGKDLAEYQIGKNKIPYYLIDVASPRSDFNVFKYQHLARRAIANIQKRGKVPFLVGGTGLYLDAVIKGYVFYQLPIKKSEQKKIRKRLSRLTLKQLLKRLKQIDPQTYRLIDKKNHRRVQRALEIFYETGQVKSKQPKIQTPDYEILILGLKFPLPEIYQRINQRLAARLKTGLVKEVKKLHQQGVSWKKLEAFGLEYRYLSRYLRGLITYQEMTQELGSAICHFARRQLTWFKRNQEIIWIKNFQEAEQKINKFLKN